MLEETSRQASTHISYEDRFRISLRGHLASGLIRITKRHLLWCRLRERISLQWQRLRSDVRRHPETANERTHWRTDDDLMHCKCMKNQVAGFNRFHAARDGNESRPKFVCSTEIVKNGRFPKEESEEKPSAVVGDVTLPYQTFWSSSRYSSRVGPKASETISFGRNRVATRRPPLFR